MNAWNSYLEVKPLPSLSGKARVPSSRPETQRAILAASLASGRSIVHNDLRCLETETMKNACRVIGATILEHDGYLEIHGIDGQLRTAHRSINALGSGLVFRVFAALTSFSGSASIITGDATLRGRVMAPLFDALRKLGASIECMGEDGCAPIVNWGGGFSGGECRLPGNVSSQFVTAILFAAPFAEYGVTIFIEGEILSVSYITQTIATLRNAGINVVHSEDYSKITVQPGSYKPTTSWIFGDYTSSSYLIGAASLFEGTTVLENMSKESLQGERAIVDVVKKMGVKVHFDEKEKSLTINNPSGTLVGNFEFDASDYPNIVPTLAAIGAHVDGVFRVVGGAITRLHKSPRIKAMITELGKFGVDIVPLMKDGVYDGFEIRGRGKRFKGGLVLSSWGDHRIFMSLFVASLTCENPNLLEGHRDVICSFPDFFEQFGALGVATREVEGFETRDAEFA